MAKKYDIALNFAQMTPIKAYILGLMWADGWITSTETECALSSNDDEIYKLNELIYPKQNHSIEKRNSGCKIIHICNKQIVSQLKGYGFCSDKSVNGIPIVPIGFEMIRKNWLAETDGENINTIIAGFNECFEAKK